MPSVLVVCPEALQPVDCRVHKLAPAWLAADSVPVYVARREADVETVERPVAVDPRLKRNSDVSPKAAVWTMVQQVLCRLVAHRARMWRSSVLGIDGAYDFRRF